MAWRSPTIVPVDSLLSEKNTSSKANAPGRWHRNVSSSRALHTGRTLPGQVFTRARRIPVIRSAPKVSCCVASFGAGKGVSPVASLALARRFSSSAAIRSGGAAEGVRGGPAPASRPEGRCPRIPRPPRPLRGSPNRQPQGRAGPAPGAPPPAARRGAWPMRRRRRTPRQTQCQPQRRLRLPLLWIGLSSPQSAMDETAATA